MLASISYENYFAEQIHAIFCTESFSVPNQISLVPQCTKMFVIDVALGSANSTNAFMATTSRMEPAAPNKGKERDHGLKDKLRQLCCLHYFLPLLTATASSYPPLCLGFRGGTFGSMGRTSTRLPSFCLNRVTTRVRVRSPAIESRPLSPQASKVSSVDDELAADGATKEMEHSRRIMIVVDRSSEAKAALHWALSHSVQSNDTVVLVEVTKPSKHGERTPRERQPKDYALLHDMKRICQARKPEVQVELSLVPGEERGPAIVGEASKRGVVLLVMGQRKRSVTWRWVMMWAGSKPGGDAVDYCIRNATCTALAVRRKSRRGGGYLITTKRHRDFWLLA